MLENLLERRMIPSRGTRVARAPVPLRDHARFLVAFGLRDLGDLPKVGELIVPELAETAAAQLTEPGPEHEETAAADHPAEQDPGSGGDRVTASS